MLWMTSAENSADASASEKASSAAPFLAVGVNGDSGGCGWECTCECDFCVGIASYTSIKAGGTLFSRVGVLGPGVDSQSADVSPAVCMSPVQKSSSACVLWDKSIALAMLVFESLSGVSVVVMAGDIVVSMVVADVGFGESTAAVKVS